MLGVDSYLLGCCGRRSTNLDVAFRKPGVRLLSWRREVPKSVLSTGVAGAVLIRVAFRSRREVYTNTLRIVVNGLCDVLKGEEVQLIVGRNRTCIHAFLGARALTIRMISEVAFGNR